MWIRWRATAAVIIAGLSMASLVACTAPDPSVDESPAASPAVGETSEALEVEPADAPGSTATPAPSPSSSSGCPTTIPGYSIQQDGELYLRAYESMVDMGPRDGAAGVATFADDGTPASYIVAPDDHRDAIVDRFCVNVYPFESLNAVRRGSLHSVDPTNQAHLTPLYSGDTLNLSPFTITSVGDVNGVVMSYEPDFILPPQR